MAISVRNAPEPIVGTLAQITENGLLVLDADSHKIGVSYRRISAIEAAPPSAFLAPIVYDRGAPS